MYVRLSLSTYMLLDVDMLTSAIRESPDEGTWRLVVELL